MLDFGSSQNLYLNHIIGEVILKAIECINYVVWKLDNLNTNYRLSKIATKTAYKFGKTHTWSAKVCETL